MSLGKTSWTAEPVVAGKRPITQYFYHADSLVKSVLDAEQHATEYEYDDRGRLKLVRLPDPGDGSHGRPEVEYVFDNANQLTAMTDALGRTTSYSYDQLGRQTLVTPPDPDGNAGTNNTPTVSYRYDALGNVLQATDALNQATTFEYDGLSRRTKTTDANGQATSFTYDLVGNMLTLTDPNANTTRWVYDALDRVATETNQLGAARTYQYDAVGNLRQATDRNGRVTRYGYDRLYRLTEEAWLPRGQDLPGAANGYLVTAAGADLQFSGADPSSMTLRAQIEAALEGLDEIVDAQVGILNGTLNITIAETDSTRLTVNDPAGALSITPVTDDKGYFNSEHDQFPLLAWTNGYFQLSYGGHTTAKIPYNTEGENRGTVGPYSPLQDAINELVETPNVVAYVHGGHGEPWRIQFVEFVNDQPHVLAVQPQLAVSDPHGLVSITPDTDANGDPLQVLAVNAQFTLSFGGETTDPLPYNATKQQIEAVLTELDTVLSAEAWGGSAYGEREFISAYFQLPAAPSHPWVIRLHAAASASPEDLSALPTHQISYQYDLAANLLSASNPAGNNRFTYDALGRPTQERQTITGLNTPVTFQSRYDLVGNRLSLAATIGGTPDFVTNYAYDDLYRMTSVTQTGATGSASAVAGATGSASAAAGATGSASAVVPKHVTFSYDVAGQMTDVTRYAAADASSGFVAQSHFGYDQAGRLTSLVHAKTPLPTTSGNTWNGDFGAAPTTDPTKTLAAYHLTYDDANRLDLFASWADKFAVDYDYDNRDQLVKAAYTGSGDRTGLATLPSLEQYAFDDNGNRLKSNNQSGSPDGQNNRLLSDGTYTFAYDGEGNRTAKFLDNGNGVLGTGDTDVTEYSWDHRNRLTKVNHKASHAAAVDKAIDYLYDAFDRRVSKTVDPDGTGPQSAFRDFFIYDGPHIALEYRDPDASGTATPFLSHRYLHGPAIDMLLADESYLSSSGVQSPTASLLWPLADHLGSTRDVVDSSGSVVGHFVYSAFGQITSESNPNLFFRFTFTGRERDLETPGLLYYRARYYSTTEGIFISQDPIGFRAGDTNLIRIVGNHPTYATDPDGLEEKGVISIAFPNEDWFSENDPKYRHPWFRERYDNWHFGVKSDDEALRLLGLDPATASMGLRLTSVYGDEFPYLHVTGRTSDGAERTYYGMFEGGYGGKPLVGYSFYNRECDLRYNLSGMDKLTAVTELTRTYGTVRVLQSMLPQASASPLAAYRFRMPVPVNVPLLRQQYVNAVNALSKTAAEMRVAGKSAEEIARALHAQRRALGVQYKNLTPDELLQQIYERNLAKYGDKLGPTIDYLRNKGKSWEEIIESACRTGGKDLGL